MEKKFTEGEWFVSNYNQIVAMSSQCKITNRVGGCNSEEAKANAKLISAAPDMLAALEYLIEAINPIDACRGKFESLGKDKAYVGGMTIPTDESILRCIEAINKATK